MILSEYKNEFKKLKEKQNNIIASKEKNVVRKEIFKLLVFACKNNDLQISSWAKTVLVSETEGFIKHVMTRYFHAFITSDYEELYQEGFVGLMKGIQSYKINKEFSLEYFKKYIIHEMSCYVSNKKNESSSYYFNECLKLQKTMKDMESKGVVPEMSLLSQETGFSEKKIGKLLERIDMRAILYMEEIEDLKYENTLSYSDLPEEQILKKERNIMIRSAVEKINDIDRRILLMKYNFFPKTYTNKEIASICGLEISDVKRSLYKSLKTLKNDQTIKSLTS